MKQRSRAGNVDRWLSELVSGWDKTRAAELRAKGARKDKNAVNRKKAQWKHLQQIRGDQ